MKWLVWSPMLGVVSGCSAPTVPERDDPLLQTDRLRYELSQVPGGWETTVVATHTNRTGKAVYFPGCGRGAPIYNFVRAGSGPEVAFSLAWACPASKAVEIPAGTTRTDTLRFVSLESPNRVPPIQPEQRVGLMRVVYAIYGSVLESGEANWRDPLPEEQRRSNVFQIEF